MPSDRDPHGEATHTELEHLAGGPSSRRPRLLVFWDGGVVTRELPAHGQLSFGRGKDCDVQIDHASVSRRHALLHVGDPMHVEDLGSSNGTRVAGRRLAPNHPTPVGPGDAVEIGAARVLLDRPATNAAEPGAASTQAMPGTVVRAESMTGVFQLLELVAPSHLSVIVLGETGVGKELAALTLHRLSKRADGPFLRLNCAALPEPLLESELFGHERGAFTGAVQAKPGLLESAVGGTVFFDEIGEMPLGSQAKLLRVLESREVTRLGGLSPRAIDVRFVAATHRDLPELVSRGAFRQDLFFRLNGVSVPIPPLRERRAEIAPLATTFAAGTATSMGRSLPRFSAAAMAALQAYGWPGNIRELKNAVERAVVVCRGPEIGLEHLPAEVATGARAAAAGSAPPSRPVAPPPPSAAPSTPPAGGAGAHDLRGELEALERQRIIDALERCGGHQGRAAELLGISRRTLLSRLDAHGLPRPRKGHEPAKR
jgi:DNA-binding NtrC family response regulator